MSRRRLVASKLVTGGLVVALGTALGGVSPLTAATEEPEIESTPWKLDGLVIEGALADVPEGVLATLLMEDGQASGSGSCNSYSGTYTLAGGSLGFGSLASTAMLCPDPLMSTETAYLDALDRVASYEHDRTGLRLLDGSGDVVLVFDAGQAPSIEGSWIVSSYVTPGRDLVPPIPGSVLTAVFGADGTLEGSSGCNHFTGPYAVDGSDVTVGSLNSTMVACGTPELQTQEADYLAALSASDEWSQDGTDLELADSTGVGRDVMVTLSAAIEPSYVGTWDVTGFDMGNGSIVTSLPGASLSAVFSAEGTIDGSSGCNTYSGPATVSGRSMTIGPLATTRSACPSGELEAQERQLLLALQGVTTWASDADGMVLRDDDGVTKVTLAPPRDELDPGRAAEATTRP